jgi:hypothetical protein
MRVDYASIPELHAAARRHRAEVIGGLIATAFVWLVSFVRKPRLGRAAGPHFAR